MVVVVVVVVVVVAVATTAAIVVRYPSFFHTYSRYTCILPCTNNFGFSFLKELEINYYNVWTRKMSVIGHLTYSTDYSTYLTKALNIYSRMVITDACKIT